MIFKIAFSVILITMSYGGYRLCMGMLDWDDEESFYIGARILITCVCALVVLVALGILFSGGGE